ncbi:MAG: tetratricopeptide repeat protein [Limisphaerales bacterium]
MSSEPPARSQARTGESPPEPESGPGPGPGPQPDRRRPTHRRRRFAPVGLLLALFVVGALTAAPPLYRKLEDWRASTLISQANELARQQLYSDAINRYQTALRLAPTRKDALRGLADIYSLFEKPAAIPAWRAVLALPTATEQDTLDFIRFTLQAQRFDLAEAELARLLARTQISVPTLVVASELFHRQGDTPRALVFAEDILRREPNDPSHALRVARFLLAMPDANRQREGFQRLAAMPPLNPGDRLAVFQALDSAPALPTPETSQFLDRLPLLPSASAADRLAQTDLRLRLATEPGTRESWIRAAVEILRNGSPEDQLTLARWLNRIREPARLLKLYSLADALALPPILPAYLDALGLTGRWEELQRATSQPLPVDPWILASFRSCAAARLHQDALAQEHWRRALEAARGDPSRLLAMGDIALRLGSRQHALEAYNVLANDDLHRTAGYRRLARVHEEAQDTERLRLLMREWSLNAPDDPLPSSRYAYLCALVRRDLPDAHSRMVPLVENHPARTAYRATLAFIELRQDQPQAAFRRLDRVRLDSPVSPQVQLVQALVLAANGQAAEAREIAQSIRTNGFLPEELELVRKLNPR